MNRELQDYVWQNCLPKEFKEEVKYEYYKTKTKKIKKECDLGFLNAHEGMFGAHNLTSDTEGEEMLTAIKWKVQEQYANYNKELKHDGLRHIEYEKAKEVVKVLYYLFGSKCLPDEEPKPAEPKFKVGDKVRIVDDSRHGQEYRGYVTEVVYVDESDPDATYKVYMYDEECGVSLWYSESDLEPYTEPKEREENAQERATLTDDCQSQCKSHHIGDANDMIDDIIKNSFREHNRLHIAAMAMQGILANSHQGMVDMKIDKVAELAIAAADKLIAECEKGGEA